MAGVGFVLRKLTQRDDLAGTLAGYFYSAVISSGPWLFTVLCLGTLVLIGNQYLFSQDIAEFRIIIIYNFAFSLVLSAPVFMVVTRYLADMIYAQDVSGAPGALVGMLTLVYGLAVPLVVAFYFFYAEMALWIKLLAVANFLLITGIWLTSVFVSALKEYAAIARSFAVGMLIAVLAAVFLSLDFGISGLLAGFNLGLFFILSDLIARILAEYPYRVREPFAFLDYFRSHWEIALSGLIYNLAIWADKWVMWSADESIRQDNGLISYPYYDGAMFLAYLSIVPAIALFTFSVETGFYEKYQRFYQDIQNHATYARIQHNAQVVWTTVLSHARNILVLQLTVAVSLILIAPALLGWLQTSPMQLGIFRYGVLGTAFHAFTLFLMTILTYFDARLKVLYVSIVFLVTNTLFTWASLGLGLSWYGWGYALSSIASFTVAYVLMADHIKKLPFETFVVSNASARL